MNLENLTVEYSGDRYCVGWEFKGDCYHFWLEGPDRATAIRLLHASHRPLFKRRPGAKDVQRLTLLVKKNELMVDDAIAQASAEHLFEKCEQKRAADEEKWRQEKEAQRKLDLAKAAAPELLAALRLCKQALSSGYQDELGEGRTGVYRRAWEAADLAIQKAEGK